MDAREGQKTGSGVCATLRSPRRDGKSQVSREGIRPISINGQGDTCCLIVTDGYAQLNALVHRLSLAAPSLPPASLKSTNEKSRRDFQPCETNESAPKKSTGSTAGFVAKNRENRLAGAFARRSARPTLSPITFTPETSRFLGEFAFFALFLTHAIHDDENGDVQASRNFATALSTVRASTTGEGTGRGRQRRDSLEETLSREVCGRQRGSIYRRSFGTGRRGYSPEENVSLFSPPVQSVCALCRWWCRPATQPLLLARRSLRALRGVRELLLRRSSSRTDIRVGDHHAPETLDMHSILRFLTVGSMQLHLTILHCKGYHSSDLEATVINHESESQVEMKVHIAIKCPARQIRSERAAHDGMRIRDRPLAFIGESSRTQDDARKRRPTVARTRFAVYDNACRRSFKLF